MRKIKVWVSILLSLVVAFSGVIDSIAKAEESVNINIQKHEFRAAWMTTVYNKDWTAISDSFTAEQQRAEYISKLDGLKSVGMNALMFQVRPMGDAFYPSNYASWSQYLIKAPGTSPEYDPLNFAIAEAHKRNMEFHAWFNPFRISDSAAFNLQSYLDRLPAASPLKSHPEWIVKYEGEGKVYHWINPGIPEARAYVINIVVEVVKNYDVDGIHLDDYFYPYPISGVNFNDDAQFTQYGQGANKGDWRRENVNKFISELSSNIRAEKKSVKFGVSPFGIWKNGTSVGGSDTNGLSSYDSLYVDSVKWINNSWIDYIIPQIYWNFGYSAAAYEKLIDWWTQQVHGKSVHLYIGHAAYKIGDSTYGTAWLNPDEVPNQIKFNRQFDEIKGSVFFGTKEVLSNKLGITDRLKSDIYKYPALIPAMAWKDNVSPVSPNITGLQSTASGLELQWSNNAGGDSSYFVVYRFTGEEPINLNDTSKIVAIIKAGALNTYKYLDSSVDTNTKYRYVATSADRNHNESSASNIVSNKGINLVSLTSDKTSPQKVYSVINFTANTIGDSQNLYRFSVFDGVTWKEMREYSSSKSFDWFVAKLGNYKIRVDGKVQGSTSDFDSRLEIDYRIQGLYKVFVDPGHGGTDSGATGYSGSLEKTINLQISKKLNELLKKSDIETMMSREDDIYVGLSERAAMANSWNSNLFISIHQNSYTSSEVNGIETYSYPGSINGSKLAAKIQNKLIQYTGANNRYAKTADYAVLRGTNMTAALVECGFISNSTEESKLLDDSYQNTVAEAVSDGILEYLGVYKEDVNKDGFVDIKDIALMAVEYNNSNNREIWEKGLDMNGDGIVDVYDLVRLSRKLR
jgi:N-acetylmuramoyl-L-alanine amidase CwlD